ncbi:hypothetical protein HYX14_05210 [Candidatus Woesearchaeota archaeon]|nr:hypothetical protein [Candidatus Woesearchaeota archaeon]
MGSENKKLLIYSLYVLVAVVLIGFLGYYFGFLGAIYNVMMPERLGAFPLIILSIIFGLAAFFSPCAFTVLPGYVAHFLTGGRVRKLTKAQTFRQSAYLGLVGATGIVVVNMIVGVTIAALGAATPFAKDPRQDIAIILGVRIVAGILIASLGVFTLLGKSINISWIYRLMAEKGFTKSIFFYGLLYNGAAIGCTGPIMLGLLLYAFASASFAGAITAFLIFSLTMGLLMFLLTVLAGLFKNALTPYLIAAAPIIKKVAAVVMIVIGLAIALLTLEGNQIFVKIFFPFLK